MTTDFDTALQRGCSTAYSLRIEGIGYVFVESEPRSVHYGTLIFSPYGIPNRIRPSLMVLPGQAVEGTLSRETGVASAKALDVVLAFSDSVTGSLFQRPSETLILTADVGAGDTVLQVDAEPAGAAVYYLGRETLEYVSHVGTDLTVTRAQYHSQPWAYWENDASSYGVVTDVPQVWKGRQVWLFEHLVSPEGRMIDASVGTTGSHSRLLWSGFVDEPPQPGPHGMVLRCQSLVRLASKDLGFQFDLHPVPMDPQVMGEALNYLIGIEDTSSVTVEIQAFNESTFALVSSHLIEAPGYDDTWVDETKTLGQWWHEVEAAIAQEVSAETWYQGSMLMWADTVGGNFVGQVEVKAGFAVKMTVYVHEGKCPWFVPGKYVGVQDGMLTIPLTYAQEAGHGWLAVTIDPGSDVEGITLPDVGFASAEGDGGTEIIGWTEVIEAPQPNTYLLRVTRRGINGTLPVALWSPGTKLTMLSGVMGPLGEAIVTLLQSSGTGLRGGYDTLDRAQGLGLHEDSIDVTGSERGILTRAPNDEVTLVQDGRVSVEGLVGGWLVLSGLCLAQVDGVLCLVPIIPTEDPDAEVIGPGDVLLASIEAETPIIPPNSITVERSGIGAEVRPLVVQDTMAMGSEGTQALTLTAPGMDLGTAGARARSILARNKGQQVLRAKLAPWKRLRLGQVVSVDLAHPMVYDWSTGTRGPASVQALVLGVETHLVDGTHTVTLLMAGLDAAGRYLCPCAVVSAFSGSDVTVDEPQWFEAGETISLYNPGEEDSESDTRVISSIVGSVITMTSALPAWVDVGTIVTYPPRASASTRQGGYAYVHADTRWEG